MCGFVALAGPRSTAPDVIERGVRALAHRGPDGRGTWRAANGEAALGHTRLAIIDLSAGGAQPMLSKSGRTVITYNGEIFNHRELRHRIGEPLRSASDTEVLVELFERDGVAALSHLRGMFAFAVWTRDELFLVRDRIGIKPCYYAERDGSIAAASEIAALLAMDATGREVDPRAVDDYLTYLYVPAPRTGLKDVKELPPGHALVWRRGGGARVERYWAPPTTIPKRSISARDVRSVLEDSVDAHLVSDAPVGVFLSGGMDSSAIVALAARRYSGRLKTMCVTFGAESSFDERQYARDVANRYGTDHEELNVSADVARIIPEMARHFGQPFGSPAAVLSYALSKATSAHVKVALAGDGGDEVLGGYPRYDGLLVDETVSRVPARVRQRLAPLLERLLPRGAERGLAANRWRRFLESMEVPIAHRYCQWVSHANAAAKEALMVDRAGYLALESPMGDYDFLEGLMARYASLSIADAAPLVDLESFLPYNVLAQSDRMSMAHGLEVRVPFCDHIVVERLSQIPLAKKIPFHVPKGLFRFAFARELPARVLTHKKVGFLPPTATWLRNDLRDLVQEYLGERSVRSRGIFKPQVVAGLLRDLHAGRADRALTIWSLLMLEGWLRYLDAPM